MSGQSRCPGVWPTPIALHHLRERASTRFHSWAVHDQPGIRPHASQENLYLVAYGCGSTRTRSGAWRGRRVVWGVGGFRLIFGCSAGSPNKGGPSGSLRFRADADKMGYDSVVPMTPEVRAVIDRVLRGRLGIGNAPLFPSPKDLGQPVSRYLCDKWLREAERLAGVEKLDGRLWHAYRAKFATEMVDVPDRVLAKLGGWKAIRTLDLYQQPSDHMMLEALAKRRELREKAGT